MGNIGCLGHRLLRLAIKNKGVKALNNFAAGGLLHFLTPVNVKWYTSFGPPHNASFHT